MKPLLRPKKIGILLKTFPKVSETFILNEILALEAGGFELEILSLRQPSEPSFHSYTKSVKARVTYVSGDSLSGRYETARRHARLFAKNPIRYFKTFWHLLRCADIHRFGEFIQAGSLSAIMDNFNLAHLHAHYANEPAGVAEFIHIFTGMSFSISTHAKDIYLSSPKSLRQKMNRSSFVVTCTEYNRNYLRSVAGGHTPVSRVYHGLVIDKFAPDRDGPKNSSKINPSPITILSVGRFRKKKGFATLIQACRLLKDEGVDFQCNLVGYGPEKESIEQLIQGGSLKDRVHLKGKMMQEELVGLYNKADMFVLPCQVDNDGDRDGIPNVIMEAMAMEIPVISTTVSGIPELIDHEKNGVLVPPKDPLSLMLAIKRLIDQPSLRKKLGAAGRQKIIESFDADHHIEHLKTMLAETIGKPDARAIAVKKELSCYAS